MKLQAITNKVPMGLQKASPYIFFGVGVTSGIGALVAGIRATMKLNDILEAFEKEKLSIEEGFQEDTKEIEDEDVLKIAKKDYDKAVRKLYFRTSGKLCRLYALTASLEALSMGSFGISLGFLRSELLTTSAALSALSEQFMSYRERVVEDAGEDKDQEYYYGVKKEKISVEETDDETGKTKKTKKDMLTGTPNGQWVYWYGQRDHETKLGSSQWDPNYYYNVDYITGVIRGYQFNLDAGKRVNFDRLLDDLGFEERPKDKIEEHIAGWLPGDIITCGLENPEKYRDVYDFVMGNKNDVLLRFNPRPDIFHAKGVISKKEGE